MNHKALIFAFINLLVISSESSKSKEEDWKGKWFPSSPNDHQNSSTDKPTPSGSSSEKWTGKWFPTSPLEKQDQYSTYEHDRIMGIPNSECDDGETNLQTDFDPNKHELVYTCIEFETLKNNCTLDPIQTVYEVPKFYTPVHKCMNSSIEYQERIPVLGYHRPLWPVFGEYEYLPPQRWLHSLEHGAIVLLYHPCVNQNELEKLRSLVKGCLFRHIITPYTKLTNERPLAILAWANSLEMSCFNKEIALEFIKKYAKTGPEQVSKQGQYSKLLKNKAEIVSDKDDSEICPEKKQEEVKMFF